MCHLFENVRWKKETVKRVIFLKYVNFKWILKLQVYKNAPTYKYLSVQSSYQSKI